MLCFRPKQIDPAKKSDPPGRKGRKLRSSVPSEEQDEMKSVRRHVQHRGQPYPSQHGRPVRRTNDVESRLMRENAELKTLLQQERDECQRAKAECEQERNECKRTKTECESVKADLQQNIEESDRAIADLRKQMQDKTKRHNQIQGSREDIERKLEKAHRELRLIKSELSESKCKQQREHNKVVLLRKEVEIKSQQLSQKGEEAIRLNHDKFILQQEFEEISSQNNELNEELQTHKERELGLAKYEITKQETELRCERETEEMGGSEEKVISRLRSEKDMLRQRLQQAKSELELKDNDNQRMADTLRHKDTEITQMKHKLNATEQSLQRQSERANRTEHELRRFGEERDREAQWAFQEINALQTELSKRDECLERIRKDKKLTEEILKAERDALQTKIDSLKAERDSIHQQYTEVRAVAETFQYRLSNEFCIRLAADETNMENISVKHRPAKIAEKFAQIESKEWVEAKEVLDERFDEKTNIQILLFMLKFACKCAQEVFDRFLSSEACRLYNPITATTDTLLTEQHQNSGGSPRVPGSILKEITAFLKETCGECDIESLTQSVVDEMKKRHGEDIAPILQDAHVRSFVQACCRLAWQMAVQQPPLTALTSNTHYDDRCHQLWYSSPPPSKSKGVSRSEIDFYIWPELRQSDKVLKKGRVCLKPKPRN